jgi:ATP-dependent DNA helicase PIF1
MASVQRPNESANKPVDEITQYQDYRSIGSSEGCWRTFGFAMYDRYPSVEQLPVHLDNAQTVRYEDGDERAAAAAGAPDTALTHWLQLLKRDASAREPIERNGRVLCSAKYADYPERYTYKKKEGWQLRKRQASDGSVIGRIYPVHPSAGESFYLRMLLNMVPAKELGTPHVPPPANDESTDDAFTLEALKYVDCVKQETFKAACVARGLLQDDNEWRLALEDAVDFRMPHAIRAIYTYIVLFNSPINPAELGVSVHFLPKRGRFLL